MRLYHRTPHAEAILRDGFRDRRGSLDLTGVWLSSYPLDENEGAKGPTVLAIDIPDEALVDLEVVEEGKPYREWCIPAEVVNRFGPPAVHDDDCAGCTEASLRQKIARLRADGQPFALEQADALEARLPFLVAHGLLAREEP